MKHAPGPEGQQVLCGELVDVPSGVQHDLADHDQGQVETMLAATQPATMFLQHCEQVRPESPLNLGVQARRDVADQELVTGPDDTAEQQARESHAQFVPSCLGRAATRATSQVGEPADTAVRAGSDLAVLPPLTRMRAQPLQNPPRPRCVSGSVPAQVGSECGRLPDDQLDHIPDGLVVPWSTGRRSSDQLVVAFVDMRGTRGDPAWRARRCGDGRHDRVSPNSTVRSAAS